MATTIPLSMFTDTQLLQIRESIDYELKLRGQELRDAPELNCEERNLVRNGRLVHAIKAYRNRTGLGLKICKGRVDLFRETL